MNKALLNGTFVRLIALPAALTAFVGLFVYPNTLPALFHTMFFFLGSLIAIGFSRFRHETLPGVAHNRLICCLRLFGMQTLLFVMLHAVALGVKAQTPMPLKHLSLPPFSHFILVDWGLFPWTLFTCVAITLSCCQSKETKGIFHPALCHFLKEHFIARLLGPLSDFFVRQSQFIVLCTVLALLLVNCIHAQGYHAATFSAHAGLFAFANLFFAILPQGRRFIANLSRRYSLWVVMGVYVCLMLTLNEGLILLFSHIHTTATPLSTSLLTRLHHQHWPVLWECFAWSVCLCATPMMATWYARQCTGQSVGFSIIATMLGPALLHVVFQHIHLPQNEHVTLSLLALSSIGLLAITSYRHLDFCFFADRVATPLRRVDKQVMSLTWFITTLLALFLLTWLWAVPVVLFLLAIPTLFILITVCFTLLFIAA